jgi:GNAT superfamily N-acetyltransferase
MSYEPLTVETRPDPADVQFLDDQINAFNIAATGVDDARLLAIFVRDAVGTLLAGIVGWTWGGCCEIRYLWVAEAQRGQGLGSRLLAAAEHEALARGCDQLILSTHEFQAPAFYQRHGYEIVGAVDNYPRGYHQFYLRKILRRPAMASNMQTPPRTV